MATFTLTPNSVSVENIEYKTLKSEFEDGTEQVRQKWENPRRSWKLKFSGRTKTDWEYARDFYIARAGGFDSFSWVNLHDDVTYTVRFEEDTMKSSLVAFELYDFEFIFKEVK